MPETFEEKINRILRDHEGYDGNGGTGPLPIGDRSTSQRPIYKRDLREALRSFADVEGNAGDALTARDEAVEAARTADEDAAQTASDRDYVETRAAELEGISISGVTRKEAVACATTANITLSGEQTIDGVTTSASRVLVKNQSAAAQNGIYVSAAGAWTRATDMDAAGEVQGAAVYVTGGTANAGKTFYTGSEVTTLGADPIAWVLSEDQSGLQSQLSDFEEYVGGREFITFTTAGVYGANGTVTQAYGGFYKEHPIAKTGLYEMAWDLAGTVRYIHAVNAAGDLLMSWNGDQVGTGAQFFVPEGATKLLLSSFGTPKNGYLTLVETRADGAVRGVISEDEMAAFVENILPGNGLTPALPNEVEHFDMRGNMFTDGLWKNSTSTDTFARVYIIDPAETYMLQYNTPIQSYEQAISTAEINDQLATGASFSPLTHNGATLNNLAADCDTVTVNGYTTAPLRYASEWTPPAGAKRLIVMTQLGSPVNRARLFKTGGRATGSLAGTPNSGKSVVVCGDSVAQAGEAEPGKSRLRGLLGSRVDTYAMGGAGWAINATPSWVTPNNISGVYQIEELVKPATRTYDIYCLSATLNDPITHNKPIGAIDNCVPYLTSGGNPDLTDPNLDTMLGALNFAIQRIYEKNPSAKIVIATMNKAFLTSPTSGFGVEAGYNPDDTTTNSSGATYYQYIEAVRSLGDKWGIPIVDVYGKAGINQFNKSAMMKDDYHPTFKGYEGIWSLWFDAIVKA